MRLKPIAFRLCVCATNLIGWPALYAESGLSCDGNRIVGKYGSAILQDANCLRIPCGRCLVQFAKTEKGEIKTNSLSFVRVENGALSIPSEIEGLCTRGIKPNAFAGNLEIREVLIPSSVAWIGERAFAGCSNLCSIVMLSGNHASAIYNYGVGHIHNEAFMDCVSLTNVVFPDRLAVIHDSAFNGCRSLKKATFSSVVGHVSGSSFDYCEGLRCGDLSLTMDAMFYAYRGCPSLEKVCVSSNNTMYAVYDGAVYYKDLRALLRVPPQLGVRTFAVRDGVKAICPFAFENSPVESVTLPDSLAYIGEQAFSCCTNLVSVSIPVGVEEIGNYAFIGCVKLKEVTFMGDQLPKIGDSAFPQCVKFRNVRQLLSE